jgi:hypothetical protein
MLRAMLITLAVTSCRQAFAPAAERFDSQAWKAAINAGRPELRYLMVKDLRERQLLSGRSRPSVLELLGEPDPGAYLGGAWDAAYLLGPERGFMNLDGGRRDCGNAWFLVRFDDAIVSKTEVLTDC